MAAPDIGPSRLPGAALEAPSLAIDDDSLPVLTPALGGAGSGTPDPSLSVAWRPAEEVIPLDPFVAEHEQMDTPELLAMFTREDKEQQHL